MTEIADHQILEHLRYIRAKVDTIDGGMFDLEARVRAAEGHMSSFFISQNRQSVEIARITARLEQIEQQLGPRSS